MKLRVLALIPMAAVLVACGSSSTPAAPAVPKYTLKTTTTGGTGLTYVAYVDSWASGDGSKIVLDLAKSHSESVGQPILIMCNPSGHMIADGTITASDATLTPVTNSC